MNNTMNFFRCLGSVGSELPGRGRISIRPSFIQLYMY